MNGRIRRLLTAHLADPQQRNAYFLMLGNLVSAAAGLAFWLLLTAGVGLDPAVIGLGYAVFSLGTLVGVVAKGGLDTALVRSVPETGRSGALSLMGFAILVGGAMAVLITLALAGASQVFGAAFPWGGLGWVLVVAIAVLLVVTWLQDAYFIGEGDARWCFHRNAVLSAGRLVLPVPVVLFALPHPVALSWAVALGFSALAALTFLGRLPRRPGAALPRSVFVRRTLRNVTGTAAEFLPGFLLAPLILLFAGAEQAGYFGIAWTAASLLFVASAAIGRSALSEMARGGPQARPHAVRKGARQHALVLLPAALVGVLLAPWIMGVFGSEYAREASDAFRVLCASIVFVAPAYLYLSLLRARDRPLVLTLFPFVMMVVLFALAPIMAVSHGLTGVALAWLLANVPFGVWGAWRIFRSSKEVMMEHGAAWPTSAELD